MSKELVERLRNVLGGELGNEAADTIERLERELATERALSFRNQVAELEQQRDELLEALDKCRFALEPYDDIKPRDWKTDREKLAFAHQDACAAIAHVKESK